jgi:uncharacterized protein YlxW (UPF0749 family)
MTKDRLTVSLEPKNAEYLRRDDINASGLVNNLVDEHRKGGVGEDYLRELREKQLQSEVESLLNQVEVKQEELDRIQSQEERDEQERQAAIDERLEKLQDVRGEITESHPTVEALATDYFNGDTTEALEAMQDRNDELNLVPEEYL